MSSFEAAPAISGGGSENSEIGNYEEAFFLFPYPGNAMRKIPNIVKTKKKLKNFEDSSILPMGKLST